MGNFELKNTHLEDLLLRLRKSFQISIAILTMTLFSSCLPEHECNNRFNFISSNDSLAILKLNYALPADSQIVKLKQLYEDDLCNRCSWVDFKTPFEIQGDRGFLKFSVDFDYPYCTNCPMTIRYREYFQILINTSNQLLVEGEPISLDSLDEKIYNYLSNFYPAELPSEHYKNVNYSVQWNLATDSNLIKSVFSHIYTSQLEFIETKLKEKGRDFCSLQPIALQKLKEEFPFRIELFSSLKIQVPKAINSIRTDSTVSSISKEDSIALNLKQVNKFGRWKIQKVRSINGDSLTFPSSIYVDLHKGTYAFPNLSVNHCNGLYKYLSADAVSFQPATCTEACCDSPDEVNLMGMLGHMSNYKIQGNQLILSGDLKFPFVFNEIIGGPDTLIGSSQMLLQKVD